MTKHVIDHAKTGEKSRRSQEYSRIDADEMPRPQTKELQRRSHTTKEGQRLKAFTDIERRGDS